MDILVRHIYLPFFNEAGLTHILISAANSIFILKTETFLQVLLPLII